MHTFIGRACRIHYSPDLSDDVFILGARGNEDVEILIPGDDLRRFITAHLEYAPITAFANTPDPEVPSLAATAKLYRERERRDRWCQFMAAAMARYDVEIAELRADVALNRFDARFPPEEPDGE